jgi:hypothetical protein
VFPKTFLKHIWSQPHPNHPNLPFGHQLLHIPKSLNLLKTKGQRSNILKQICFWNFEAQNPQHSQDYDLKIEPSGKKNPNKIIQQIPPTSYHWLRMISGLNILARSRAVWCARVSDLAAREADGFCSGAKPRSQEPCPEGIPRCLEDGMDHHQYLGI